MTYLVWQECEGRDLLIGVWPDRARANGQIGETSMGLADDNGSLRTSSNGWGMASHSVICKADGKRVVIYGTTHNDGVVNW